MILVEILVITDTGVIKQKQGAKQGGLASLV